MSKSFEPGESSLIRLINSSVAFAARSAAVTALTIATALLDSSSDKPKALKNSAAFPGLFDRELNTIDKPWIG